MGRLLYSKLCHKAIVALLSFRHSSTMLLEHPMLSHPKLPLQIRIFDIPYVYQTRERLIMRALVDIPDDLLKDLAELTKSKKLPRAEVIRRAIRVYVTQNKPSSDDAFGILAGKKIDGVLFQEKIRSEW